MGHFPSTTQSGVRFRDSVPAFAAAQTGRPLALAGIGLDLLGYARVAAMLHRVAMTQESARIAEAAPMGFSSAEQVRGPRRTQGDSGPFAQRGAA